MSHELPDTKAGILLNQISDHLPYFIRYPITRPKNKSHEIKIYPNELVASERHRQFLADVDIMGILDVSEDADPCRNYNILNNKLKEGTEIFFLT